MGTRTDITLDVYTVLWKCRVVFKELIHTEFSRDIIYGLIFLKLASYDYNRRKKELMKLFENDVEEIDNSLMYSTHKSIYMNRTSNWEYLFEHSDNANICELLENALADISNENLNLVNNLPKGSFMRFKGNEDTIRGLMSEIHQFNEKELMNKSDIVTAIRMIQRIGNYMF